MTSVLAVAFEKYGTLHYLDADGVDYAPGDLVLFPTEEGMEVAECVLAPRDIPDTPSDLPRCGGRATDADLRRDGERRERRAGIRDVAREVIARHGLPMSVVAADIAETAEGTLAAIYYTAPHRVDFRGIISELARAVGARIDLRQVGDRDRARLVGDVGSCGRPLCCTTFLDDLEPVSIRLARIQGLAANPLQVAGACGRLKCCLRHEEQVYVEFLRRAPAIGSRVETDQGMGVVTGHNVPGNQVSVATSSGVIRHVLDMPRFPERKDQG